MHTLSPLSFLVKGNKKNTSQFFWLQREGELSDHFVTLILHYSYE